MGFVGEKEGFVTLWLPPVFELVAATPHWGVTFIWVRLPGNPFLKKERPPDRWSFFFGAGYGNRTRLRSLGSYYNSRYTNPACGGIITNGV